MSLSSLGFLIEEALKSIRRNGLMSLTAFTTVTMALSVFGGAAYALYRVHQIAQALPRQFQISVFLRMEVPRDQALRVADSIRALPDVAAVTLVTREEAWAEMEREHAGAGAHIADALAGENPYPDRLDVEVRAPERAAAVTAALRGSGQFPEIDEVRDARDALERALAAGRVVRNAGGIVALALLGATLVVIQNTIRLTVIARWREIRIMQLVGATGSFIRLPLLLEGLFYGMVGGLLAGTLVAVIARELGRYAATLSSPLTAMAPPPLSALTVLVGLTALGALIGLTASAISIRRFLVRA
ncbi:MAG TPA: permease-like cell division protein FtsX [Chthonomonadales bacterium]|nr:permease-like cell division protein FtsX [Chthonomonadales bacterium]